MDLVKHVEKNKRNYPKMEVFFIFFRHFAFRRFSLRHLPFTYTFRTDFIS